MARAAKVGSIHLGSEHASTGRVHYHRKHPVCFLACAVARLTLGRIYWIDRVIFFATASEGCFSVLGRAAA